MDDPFINNLKRSARHLCSGTFFHERLLRATSVYATLRIDSLAAMDLAKPAARDCTKVGWEIVLDAMIYAKNNSKAIERLLSRRVQPKPKGKR